MPRSKKTTAPAPEAPADKSTEEKAPETEVWARMSDAPKSDHEIHKIVAQRGAYGRFTCRPKVSGMLAAEVDPSKFEFCAYCLDGAERPADEAPAAELKNKAPKTPRQPAEPVAPAVALFEEATGKLITSVEALVAEIVGKPAPVDAATLHAALVKAISGLRPAMPSTRKSRSTSSTPGIRAARGAYGAEVKVAGDTPEIAEIRLYANNGDKRAADIIAHIEAYVEGKACSYCAGKGRPGAIHRRTGFMSAGREIEGMRARKVAADNAEPVAPSAPAADKPKRERKPKPEAKAPEAPAAEVTPEPKADKPKRDRRGRPPRNAEPTQTPGPDAQPNLAEAQASVTETPAADELHYTKGIGSGATHVRVDAAVAEGWDATATGETDATPAPGEGRPYTPYVAPSEAPEAEGEVSTGK